MGGKNTPQRRPAASGSASSPAGPRCACASGSERQGNKREIYGQGRPQAKDSSGNGANWYLGTVSNPAGGGSNVESRFFFEGTVSGGTGGWTSGSLGTATDAREAQRIGIFGTSNSYGGSYGRVTNEALDRDLNPLGRGDGVAYVAGQMGTDIVSPSLPMTNASWGSGSSVNNDDVTNLALGDIIIEWDAYAEENYRNFCEVMGRDYYRHACTRRPQCPGCGAVLCSGKDWCSSQSVNRDMCAKWWCKYYKNSNCHCEWVWFEGATNCWPAGFKCKAHKCPPNMPNPGVMLAQYAPPGTQGGVSTVTPVNLSPLTLQASQSINVSGNSAYIQKVRNALNIALYIVSLGMCVTNSCAPLGQGNTNLRDCLLDLLQNGNFTINLRWFGSFGVTSKSHPWSNSMDIFISRINKVCGGVWTDDLAASILHELVHFCQYLHRGTMIGQGVSCCDTSSDPEPLAFYCQAQCFPNACLSKTMPAGRGQAPAGCCDCQ